MTAAHDLTEALLVVAGDVVTDKANLAALLARFGEEGSLAASLIRASGAEAPHDLAPHVPRGGQVAGRD